MTDSKFCKF